MQELKNYFNLKVKQNNVICNFPNNISNIDVAIIVSRICKMYTNFGRPPITAQNAATKNGQRNLIIKI